MEKAMTYVYVLTHIDSVGNMPRGDHEVHEAVLTAPRVFTSLAVAKAAVQHDRQEAYTAEGYGAANPPLNWTVTCGGDQHDVEDHGYCWRITRVGVSR